MSIPNVSSVSSETSFLRKLTSDTENRSRSNRGIIQLNSRLTPCIRDPSQPRWSHTCRMFSGRFSGLEPKTYASADLKAAHGQAGHRRQVRLAHDVARHRADADVRPEQV